MLQVDKARSKFFLLSSHHLQLLMRCGPATKYTILLFVWLYNILGFAVISNTLAQVFDSCDTTETGRMHQYVSSIRLQPSYLYTYASIVQPFPCLSIQPSLDEGHWTAHPMSILEASRLIYSRGASDGSASGSTPASSHNKGVAGGC